MRGSVNGNIGRLFKLPSDSFCVCFRRPSVQSRGNQKHRHVGSKGRAEAVTPIRYAERFDKEIIANAPIDRVAEDGASTLGLNPVQALPRNARCGVHCVGHRGPYRPLTNDLLHIGRDSFQVGPVFQIIEKDRKVADEPDIPAEQGNKQLNFGFPDQDGRAILLHKDRIPVQALQSSLDLPHEILRERLVLANPGGDTLQPAVAFHRLAPSLIQSADSSEDGALNMRAVLPDHGKGEMRAIAVREKHYLVHAQSLPDRVYIARAFTRIVGGEFNSALLHGCPYRVAYRYKATDRLRGIDGLVARKVESRRDGKARLRGAAAALVKCDDVAVLPECFENRIPGAGRGPAA